MTHMCQAIAVSIQTGSLLRLCSLLTKTCSTISQETKFPRELRNHKSVYNRLSFAYTSFRCLCQVNMFQCFILHSSVDFVTHTSPQKNYWRKNRLCFLNFMGTPTASSSQNTMSAGHCHCCVLVFLLECKSQGSEFPYFRGTWNSRGNCSFFPSLLSQACPYFGNYWKGSFLLFLVSFPLVL